MRRLNIFILIILLAAAGFSQNTVDTKTAKDTKTSTDTKTATGEKTVTADTKTTEAKTEGTDAAAKKESESQKLPVGYGDLTWGVYLSDARPKVAGVLVYTDEKKIIVSKDGDLEYRYGFFYVDPTVAEDEVPVSGTEEKKEGAETATTDGTTTAAEEKKDEGKLFYVSLNFPYLDKDFVYNKIKKKYGNHSGENIKDNQGAIAWNSEDTIVIMWVDRYKKKPYCRRVVYISKKISKELNDYTYRIFNKTEMDLIKKLNP